MAEPQSPGAMPGADPGSEGKPSGAGVKPEAPEGSSKGNGKDEVSAGEAEQRVRELEAANRTLMGKLEATTKEAIERRQQLKAYEGIDPEAFRKWEAEQADRERVENEKRGEYEKNVLKEREAKAAALRERDEIKRSWHEFRVKSALLAAAAAAGATEHALKPVGSAGDAQIVSLTFSQFEFDEKSDRVAHRSLTNEAGERLTPEAFFSLERSKSLANQFRAAAKPGTGASGGEPPASGEPVRIRITGGHLAPSEALKAEEAQKKGLPIEVVRD